MPFAFGEAAFDQCMCATFRRAAERQAFALTARRQRLMAAISDGVMPATPGTRVVVIPQRVDGAARFAQFANHQQRSHFGWHQR